MPSFKIIGLPVLEKIFEVFFSIYGCGNHPGHVTWTFYFPPSKGGSTRYLALIGQAVLEKKSFENGGHIHVYTQFVKIKKKNCGGGESVVRGGGGDSGLGGGQGGCERRIEVFVKIKKKKNGGGGGPGGGGGSGLGSWWM